MLPLCRRLMWIEFSAAKLATIFVRQVTVCLKMLPRSLLEIELGGRSTWLAERTQGYALAIWSVQKRWYTLTHGVIDSYSTTESLERILADLHFVICYIAEHQPQRR